MSLGFKRLIYSQFMMHGQKNIKKGIRSEKCFVRRFRRCANVIECTYTNLDSTV